MKNQSNQIALIYIIILMFISIVYYKSLQNYTIDNNHQYLYFLKDIIFVLFSGIIMKIIISQNNTKSIAIYQKLKDTIQEIKESNDKYDIVAKATSDTIWDWKIQEDSFTWNKGINTIFGYKENEIGHNSNWWFDKIHPEDSIKMSVKLYSFLEQKTVKWQDEYRFKCADNTYKYVLDKGFLLKDENGKGTRMIGAIQDITKQKEEEQRLKLLETVITQSKDSIIIIEGESYEGTIPKIIYSNPAFSIMSGYQFDEIVGKSPDMFMGKNSDLNEYEKLIKAINDKKECQIETISYTKKNEEYLVQFSMIPVYNSENELLHWISIQRDISQQKKEEIEKEKLILELIQKNKDLKQFSYITSHNLRAPLSNLSGLLTLIEDIPIENLELKEILNGFNKSTHLLNETINDLVKVIVIKENLSLHKEAIKLEDIFTKVIDQLSFLIKSSKPTININLKNASILNSNKAYLESIFLNLITNSLKFKSENRAIEINISANKIGNAVTILFSDNGIGIDLKRNHDKVFGLYQRFHNHADSRGLGLYLVKSQVESMGGTIEIESEVNKGTTFTLTFKNKL